MKKKIFFLTLGVVSMRNAGLSVRHFLVCNWASGPPIRRRGYRWTLVTPPATTRPSSSGRPLLPSSSLLHTHAGKWKRALSAVPMGSGFAIRIRIQKGKNEKQKIEKVNKFHFLKCCMLKKVKQFSTVFVFFNFWSSRPAMLDPGPYPDPDSMNPEPQHCSSPTSESKLLYGKPLLFSSSPLLNQRVPPGYPGVIWT